MSTNKFKNEPIVFFFSDGEVSAQPKNGTYWTKHDVLSHLETAGIKYPLYHHKYYVENGNHYMKLYNDSVSAVMPFEFWKKYVSTSEVKTLESLRIKADNGYVLNDSYDAARLIMEDSYTDKISFCVEDNDEIFEAILTEEESIRISNSKGKAKELTVEDVMDNCIYQGRVGFMEFDFILETSYLIDSLCEELSKK